MGGESEKKEEKEETGKNKDVEFVSDPRRLYFWALLFFFFFFFFLSLLLPALSQRLAGFPGVHDTRQNSDLLKFKSTKMK